MENTKGCRYGKLSETRGPGQGFPDRDVLTSRVLANIRSCAPDAQSDSVRLGKRCAVWFALQQAV